MYGLIYVTYSQSDGYEIFSHRSEITWDMRDSETNSNKRINILYLLIPCRIGRKDADDNRVQVWWASSTWTLGAITAQCESFSTYSSFSVLIAAL